MNQQQARETFGPWSFAFNGYGIGSSLRFELRPISINGRDKEVGFTYVRNGDKLRQSGICKFTDGQWRNLKGKPLEGDYFWALLVDE